MVVCPKCGSRNSDENVFCANCQNKLFRRPGRYTTTETRQSPIRLVNNAGIGDPAPNAEFRLYNKQASEEKTANPGPAGQQEAPPFEREPYRADPEPSLQPKAKVQPIRKIINILLIITIPAMLYLAYFIIGMADATTPIGDSRASSIFMHKPRISIKRKVTWPLRIYMFNLPQTILRIPWQRLCCGELKKLTAGCYRLRKKKFTGNSG